MTCVDLPQQRSIEAIRAVHIAMYPIADAARLSIEPVESFTKEPLHRAKPILDRTMRDDEVTIGTHGVQRLVPKRDGVVEEGVVATEEAGVDSIEQRNRVGRRSQPERQHGVMQRRRAGASQTDAEHLAVQRDRAFVVASVATPHTGSLAHNIGAVWERERIWRLGVLGNLVLIAPFNIVGQRSGGWLLMPLVAVLLVVGVLVAVSGLLAQTDRPWPRRLWVFDVASALCLVGIWVAVLASDDRWASAGAGCRVSVPIVLAVAAAHTVVGDRDIEFIARRAVIAAMIAVTIGFAVLIVGRDFAGTSRFFGQVTRLGPHDRLTRPWSHANAAAMAIGVTFFMATTLRNQLHRQFVLTVLAIAMIATYSRGGAASLLVGAAVWFLLRRKRTDLRPAAALTAVAAIAALLLPGWIGRTSGSDQLDWYQVAIEAPASFVVVGGPHLAPVEVTNNSAVTWPAQGDEAVIVTARWVEPGTTSVRAEDRLRLPRDLEPGDVARLDVPVGALTPNGTYDVWWDLLIPDRAYFRQFADLEPVRSQATVTASRVPPSTPDAGELVPPREFGSRQEIFTAGLDTWRSAPLIGVGPGRFTADEAEYRQVAHAHNIAIEPLATWGLLGAAPWIVMIAGALWFAVANARRFPSTTAIAVASSLAVAVAHGLVDWPLLHVGVAVPLGLLLGAAWAVGIPARPAPATGATDG